MTAVSEGDQGRQGVPRTTANKGDTYLFHFYSPHRAANVNDKEDVFGNWVQVVRSEKVDKIPIKYLENRTQCLACRKTGG